MPSAFSKDKLGVSRRRFIVLSLAGSAAAAASLYLGDTFRFVSGEQSPEDTAGRGRRWVMVIDLDRCDGCGWCTLACKAGHFVPDGQEWIKVYDLKTGPLEESQPFPVPCMNCENAPCVKVCPVNATFHDEEGIVVIDSDRCIGCRFCMAACPYDVRYFNWEEPVHTPAELNPVDSSLHTNKESPLPRKRGVVEKCTFCGHLAVQGQLPYCVRGCPHRALYYGDANEDIISNGAEVVRFSDLLSQRGPYRYKEELGTEPKVYYLPPRGT